MPESYHIGFHEVGKHTSNVHLKQGFPSHSGKEVRKAVENLVKARIVIVAKKTNEDHVCLNKDKNKIIYEIVDWFTKNMNLMDKENLEKTCLEIDIS